MSLRDALVARMGSKHGETSGTEPTARRETIRFGFARGFAYGHLFTGLEEAAGNGSNATPIPPRWSGVFIKAYARGQHSGAARTVRRLRGEVVLLKADEEIAEGTFVEIDVATSRVRPAAMRAGVIASSKLLPGAVVAYNPHSGTVRPAEVTTSGTSAPDLVVEPR